MTILSGLLGLLLLAGCGPSEKVVRLGVAVPLTGDTGIEGQGILRAVQLAVEEAEAAKRFPFRLEVHAVDDRAAPEEAVRAARLIISDPRVVAVVGHYNSGCTITAAPVYARAGLPLLVPAATNPLVTSQQLAADWPGPRNVFRLCPTDDVQGSFAARFIRRRLGIARLAVVHDETPYGQGLAEQVRRDFAASGGSLAAFEGVSASDGDLARLVQRLKEAKPGGIYFGGFYTRAGLLLKRLKDQGVTAPFISGDGSRTDSLFEVAGDSADGAYLTMVGVPAEALPSADDFIRKYRTRYGASGAELKPFDHFAYEAAQIILDALAKVGPEPRKLIAEIAATDRDGILGRLRFDEKGDVQSKVITMTRADWKTRRFSAIH